MKIYKLIVAGFCGLFLISNVFAETDYQFIVDNQTNHTLMIKHDFIDNLEAPANNAIIKSGDRHFVYQMETPHPINDKGSMFRGIIYIKSIFGEPMIPIAKITFYKKRMYSYKYDEYFGVEIKDYSSGLDAKNITISSRQCGTTMGPCVIDIRPK